MPDVSRRKLFAGLVTLPVLGSLSAFADKTGAQIYPAHFRS
jgi:hypothetical protein